MAVFPTSTAPTNELDEGTDSPKNARSAFLTALNLLNQIINSFNQALGICGLDAGGNVPAGNLAGSVDQAAVQDDAIESRNIKAGEVNFNHLNATITNSTATPTGGEDGDLWFIYD